MNDLPERLVAIFLQVNDDFGGDSHPEEAGYVDYTNLNGVNYTIKVNIFPTEDE